MVFGKKRLALGLALLLTATFSVQAKPIHKQALAEYFGPFLAKKLNDCRTCHLPDDPKKSAEDNEDKPHNAFGARLAEMKSLLRKAGKKFDIPSRIEAIAQEDADGDGVTNLIEIVTGHFPGDAKDRPTDLEIKAAPKTLEAFRAYRKNGGWNPFQTVKKPAIPKVKNQSWVRNPIDAFLSREHDRQGFKPRPPAAKQVLLRRVYLDLIGLPPTPAEMRAFLADHSANAYEKVVDRLLASPRYGERWGRHWMDVWRYADWAGYGPEVRDSQKHVWRWRDWIIESLNDDKGYDRMIQEMLAGDEIAPTEPRIVRATGFLARNWFRFNRNVWLENTIEHTSKAFLGLTMNCAKCHDHFFDPIPQNEYYAFRAIFEPYDVRIDRVPGQINPELDGVARVYDAHLGRPTHLFVRGQENNIDKTKKYPPATPAALGGGPLTVATIALPLLAYQPDKRTAITRDLLAVSGRTVLAAKGKWEQLKRGNLEQARLADSELALAEAKHLALKAVLQVEQVELDGGPKKTPQVWQRAARNTVAAQRLQALAEAIHNHRLADAAVKQSQAAVIQATKAVSLGKDKNANTALVKAGTALTAAKTRLAAAVKTLTQSEQTCKQPLSTNYTKRVVPTFPASSSGRRLALARWIANRNNPLTARVAMNHLWLRHFGKAIVPTVFDFGRNGQPPSHPSLLDWLAAEFMDRHWSMKKMHRLMVTSNAYRMDSGEDLAQSARDPDNRLVWKMNARRMEAELVRDSVLYLSGQLDLTMSGPDIDHSLGLVSRRRSLYLQHAAEKQVLFLSIFDAANVTECYSRSESIVPQQALALANSGLVLAQARLLAKKLTQSTTTQNLDKGTIGFVAAGFERILGRSPSSREMVICQNFLKTQSALLADKKKLTLFNTGTPCPIPPAADAHQRARENLIHVLFNHNEFVTIR